MIIFYSSNAKFHHTEINDPSFIPAHLQTAKQQKLVLLYTKSMFNSLFVFSAFHYNLFFVAVKLIKVPLKALSTSLTSLSSTLYYLITTVVSLLFNDLAIFHFFLCSKTLRCSHPHCIFNPTCSYNHLFPSRLSIPIPLQ